MNPIATLMLLFLLICRAGASDLPPDAQAAVDREVLAEAQLKADCDAKVAKLHSELASRLKKSQDAAVHRGDLDGAEAVKMTIAKLQGRPERQLIDPSTLGRITAEEWDQLPGDIITVDAKELDCDARVTLAADEHVVVVPHPNDLWTDNITTTAVHNYRSTGIGSAGSMMWRVGHTIGGVDPTLSIAGPGQLFLSINDAGSHDDNVGTIRVKIIPAP